MKINKRILLLLAAAVGIIVSAMLLKHHFDLSYKSPLCGASEKSGCNVLNRSSASVLFGIPVALIGFLYYGFSFFMSLYYNRDKSLIQSVFILSSVALLVDITLLLYSLFVAETICALCSVTYLATIAIFSISLLELQHNKMGYFPSFSNWSKSMFSLTHVSVLSSLIVFLAGGYLFQAYSKNQAVDVSKRGGYEDHMIIAENEYIKSYLNQTEYQFQNDPPSKKGPLKGILNIVEFADFLCPHCKIMTEELGKFAKKFPNEVSVTYRHFPLDQSCNRSISRKFHDGACSLSYASYCALKQDRFWEMTSEIFNNQGDLATSPVSEERLMSMSKSVGLNQGKFKACLSDDETKRVVELDVEEGINLGLQGTPTIYINGRKMDFNPHLSERLLMFEKQKNSRAPSH
jgi:protein-disulfide isomerase/uncharacterized membrane protein